MNTENYGTITQTQGHSNVSSKYDFIPTARMLNVLADHGWLPAKIQEANTRKESNRGFQKHIVRLRNESQLPVQVGEYVPEIVLINSHMGTSAFKLMAGIFRLVCTNGLVTGESWATETVRHIGFAEDKAELAILSIASAMPKTIEAVEAFRAVALNDNERMAFAESAIELIKDPEDTYQLNPKSLLSPMRWQDKSDQSLWGTYNVVQEHVIKGGVRRYDTNGRRNSTRAVKNIDRNVAINRALWTLAEKMASLKSVQ